MEGTTPFTSFPLTLELARLGVVLDELGGGLLGVVGEQMDDSGLGREELSSQGDEDMAGQEERLRISQDEAGQAKRE